MFNIGNCGFLLNLNKVKSFEAQMMKTEYHAIDNVTQGNITKWEVYHLLPNITIHLPNFIP